MNNFTFYSPTYFVFGKEEEDIPYLAHTAAYGNGNGGTMGGFVVLKEKDMENIYRLML